LRRAVELYQPEVELGIASPGAVEHDPFSAGNATYYHIPTASPVSGTARIVERWRHDPVPDGAVARCEEIARAYAPDIAHIHGAEHYFGLVIPRLRVPAIVSLQGVATVSERFVLSALGISGALREIPTTEFILGRSLHTYYKMRARARVERRIVASCDEFMGRTEWDKAVLRTLRPGARYHEVGEVLGEVFYQTRWRSGVLGGGQTLFCTAGASPLKGTETLLEALKLLRRSGVRRPRLRLAGEAAHGLMARRIRKLLGSPELCGAVDVLGLRTPAQIADELARASAFVLPSHIENSPNALCEAMAVGTPCIAAYVGGVPSLVRNEVDGLLYHDADPFALAGKIDRMLGDHDLAARLGASGRARALQRHDPATVSARAVTAYRDVLGRSRGGDAAP
jgi:glycosyltransferase involved in cell wall biosynthesis